MNLPTDNPKNQPANFDFILNQPGGPSSPKKKNNKIILLFVLVVALIIMGIAGLLLAPSRRVKKVELTQEQISQQQTVKDFLTLVDQGDFEAAYSMMSQDSPPVTKEDFLNQAVPFLKVLRLKECTYKTIDAVNATQQTRPVATCYTVQENLRIDQEFEIDQDNPRTIVNYGYIDPGLVE